MKLKPILVNGVLRVGGRLDKAAVDLSVRHPVILPSDSFHRAFDLTPSPIGRPFRDGSHVGIFAAVVLDCER